MAQKFDDFEIIILDDASTDNSCEVIKDYLKDPRVSFYQNNTNTGSPFIQWNQGVKRARGEYVWIAESDDFCSKEFLCTLVPILDKYPNVGLAYCQSWHVDANGTRHGTLEDWTCDLDAHRWSMEFVNNGRSECAEFLMWKCTIPNASAVLFKKDAFICGGWAPSDMRLCGDWLTWVRILMSRDVAFSPLMLNNFRDHSNSVRQTTQFLNMQEEAWRIRHFIFENCPLSRATRRKLAKHAVNEWLMRFRAAAPTNRKQKAVKALLNLKPFFYTAPVATLGAFLRRHNATK